MASSEITAILKQNIGRNRLTNVVLENVAIGDRNGEIFDNLASDHNIGQTAISEDTNERQRQEKIWAAILESGFTPYVLQEEYNFGDHLKSDFVESDLREIKVIPNKPTCCSGEAKAELIVLDLGRGPKIPGWRREKSLLYDASQSPLY